MQRPVEIHFRDCHHSEAVEQRISDRAEKLDRLHPKLSTVIVHVEQPHRHRHSHQGWKVSVEVVVATDGSFAVSKASDEHDKHDDLYKVIDAAFQAAHRRLEKVAEKDRGEVKHHAEQGITAVIRHLLADHGYLTTSDGREVYFHRNSVIDTPFEELKLGMGVSFSEVAGEKMPHATSVHIKSRQPVPFLPPPG